MSPEKNSAQHSHGAPVYKMEKVLIPMVEA